MYAYYSMQSKRPPCTSWDATAAYSGYPKLPGVGLQRGFIQRISNPVPPGETVTATEFHYVYHEDEPQFGQWRLYNIEFGIRRLRLPRPDRDGEMFR